MSVGSGVLSGQTAIVTGSAQGLGQAIAHGLALAGCDVVGVDRLSDQKATLDAVEDTGRRFVPVLEEVGAAGAQDVVVRACLDAFQRVDILVNNAGVLHRAQFLDAEAADWDRVMAVNLRGLFLLSQAVARQMVQAARGSIINIASLLSFQGSTKVSSYTASKTGLVGLTRAMANELAPHGIRVNAIAPGYMATENTALLRSSPKRDAVLSMIPLGRWGQPSDLQGPVVFLASSASAYITGQVLVVDGGWLSGNI